MEVFEVVYVLILSVLKLIDKNHFGFRTWVNLVFGNNIVLYLMIDSDETISSKIGLFKKQCKFCFSFSLPYFSLKLSSLARKIEFDNVLKNESN